MVKYLQKEIVRFKNSNMCSLVDNEHIYCFIDSDHQEIFKYDESELEKILRNLVSSETIWVKMYNMASYIRITTNSDTIKNFIEMEV